ncbi:MAG: pilus assembly protein PilM [Deltaproteobacteria bacterium]|nr:pilus assembly protein PilM [Deltaproteobacteria bacterium]
MPIYIPGCRIVGVDIGSRAIKAVRITTSLQSYTITGFALREHKVGTWAELTEELRSLTQEKEVQGDIYVTSFPSHQVLFRTTEMPFNQLDKIDATIRFEAESIMAVPLDDMVVDFTLLEQRPEGSTVLITCVEEELLNEYIHALQAADITPDTIDIDALALARLMEGLKEERVIALLDIGAEKASIGIFQKGGLRFIRSIPMETAAKATLKKLKPSLDEVILSMNAYQGTKGGQIDEIWLIGGNSRIKGMAEYLEKGIARPISWPDLMGKFPSSIPVSEAMNLVGGVALGLALRGLRQEKGRVDLARKIARPAQIFPPGLRKRAMQMGLAAVIFLVLIAANFFLGIWAQERRYAIVKGEMRRVFQETFPAAHGAVNELQQAQVLVKGMVERGVKLKSNNGGTPLDIIREIAQRLPQGAKIVELDIEGERVNLKGMAPSFASVDEVKGAFAGSQLFHDIKVGNVELSRRGEQGVIFQMVLALEAK